MNSVLLVTTRNVLPDTTSLPQFTTPRKNLERSESDSGITPYNFGVDSVASSEDSILSRHSSEFSVEKASDTSSHFRPEAYPVLPQGSVLSRNPERQDSGETNAAVYGSYEDDAASLSEDLGPVVQPSTSLYTGPKQLSSYPIVHPIGVGPLPSPSATHDSGKNQSLPERKETFASNQAEFGSDEGH